MLIRSQNDEECRFRTKYENQLSQLKEELVASFTLRGNLESELTNLKNTLHEHCSEKSELREQLTSIGEELSSVQDVKASLELELEDSRLLLEAANEGRILAEQGQAKARDHLDNIKCTLEQEIAALKFQLSSDAMKFETEIKVSEVIIIYGQRNRCDNCYKKML